MTEKKDNRVNQIIDAAIEEFLEKGYEKTSMESIAKRANLSKGGLYHHFKSKVEILFAVNLKLMEPVQDILARIESCNSLVERLHSYIESYLEFWNNHKRELELYFLTMNESFRNPQIMELYKEMAKQIFDYFAGIFQKGQDENLFLPGDSHARAVSLISCLDGFLGYLLIDQSLSVRKASREIQNIFIDNILKQ